MKERPSDDTLFLRVLSRQAVAAGALQEAWDLLQQMADPDHEDDRAMLEVAHALGVPALYWQTLLRMVDRPAPLCATLVASAQGMVRSGDPEGAIFILERLRERTPQDLGIRRALLEALVAAGRSSVDEQIGAWLSLTDRPEDLLQAAEHATEVGAIVRAQALYRRVRSVPEVRVQALAGLSRLTLWDLALEEAQELAGEALSFGPSLVAEHTIAGVGVLQGQLSAALVRLDRLLALQNPDPVAHAWRADALLRMKRPDAALQSADQAMQQSRRFNLPARVLRFLALPYDEFLNREILNQLVPIFGPAPPENRQTLVTALAAFGGNRTAAVTWRPDGVLQRYPRPPDPRKQGRQAQSVFKVRGPDAARARLDWLLTETGGHPLVHTYRGEFLLWCGDYAAAAETFMAALERDPETKWAWIGLGATWMLRAERQRALSTWEEGLQITRIPGPTLWAYKGECLLREGRLDAAEEALSMALETSPRRLATHINLALLQAEQGNTDRASALAERLASEGSALVGEGTAQMQLKHALARMRGNRSSSLVSWFDDRDQMHLLHWSMPPSWV